jgi:hypothetical protein
VKRLILALVVGGVVFGTVLGVAAGLGVTSRGLQSGAGSVVCDSDGVVVDYQNVDANADYDQATVRKIDCLGTYEITVDVQDGLNATLAYGTNSTSGSTAVVTFTDKLVPPGEVANADHVVVTIVGTGP